MALLIETSNAYARGILRGIMAYVRESRRWSIYHGEFSRGEVLPQWLKEWNGEGIIARIENQGMAQVVVDLGLPTVDVSAAQLLPKLPCVETDDAAIATLVAEHLLERGFAQFAYLGDERFNWSRLRRARFVQLIAEAGHNCHEYQGAGLLRMPGRWDLDAADLGRWINQLSKPVGIMAAWDGFGEQLLEACRQAGIAVPDEVAVIGVDNDEVICELSDPPLSSVATDSHRTGYEAASLLDRMMSGKKVAGGLQVIRPLGIVTRQSTDVLAIDDRRISGAVSFIREHACDGISVEDVLEAVSLSRRILETRFRKLFDRSPHQEILRVQLQRVKQLLIETDLTLGVISRRAGFKHQEYMSVVFKRLIGQPPGEYRRQLGRQVSTSAGTRRKLGSAHER